MSSWSYSAYSSAVSCLRKYKLTYIDKIVPEGPEGGDLLFGSALHCAINSCLTGQDGLATFEMYWSMYQNKEVEYGRYKWAELASLGTNFIGKFIKYHAGKYSLEFAEKRLFAEYKGIKLEGTPDFYGQYGGRASLRDFKTSGRNYEPAKSDCALQLYLYSFLYRANFPTSRIDTLGYTVFNKGTGSIQQLTWDFDEAKMTEVLDNMWDYCSMIERQQGPLGFPKQFNACLDYNRKCQFFNKCHKETE